MTRDPARIESHKTYITRELFVRTADENYITARWCFTERVTGDFLWLSVHALEKYLKAILLLNGRSAIRPAPSEKTYAHNIDILWQEVQPIAAGLLPSTLTQPSSLDVPYWITEEATTFVARLYRNGNADNRYLLYGYAQDQGDLFKVDQLVFSCRRACRRLDDAYFSHENRRRGAPTSTHRDMLMKQASMWELNASLPLEETMAGRRGEVLRDVLLRLNIPFAPTDYAHKPLQTSSCARNPVLLRLIRCLDPDSVDTPPSEEERELASWLLDNVVLPGDLKADVKQVLRRLSAQ